MSGPRSCNERRPCVACWHTARSAGAGRREPRAIVGGRDQRDVVARCCPRCRRRAADPAAVGRRSRCRRAHAASQRKRSVLSAVHPAAACRFRQSAACSRAGRCGTGEGFLMRRIAWRERLRLARSCAIPRSRAVRPRAGGASSGGDRGGSDPCGRSVASSEVAAARRRSVGWSTCITQYRGAADRRGRFSSSHFRWLRDHLPPAVTPALVRGDYRHGNLIIGAQGVLAVLDWELARSGDPGRPISRGCASRRGGSASFDQAGRRRSVDCARNLLGCVRTRERGVSIDRSAPRVVGRAREPASGESCAPTCRSGCAAAATRASSARRSRAARRRNEELDLLRTLSPDRQAPKRTGVGLQPDLNPSRLIMQDHNHHHRAAQAPRPRSPQRRSPTTLGHASFHARCRQRARHRQARARDCDRLPSATSTCDYKHCCAPMGRSRNSIHY